MDYEKLLKIMIKKDPQTWWGEYPPKWSYRSKKISSDLVAKSWKNIFLQKGERVNVYVNIPVCQKRCFFCKYYSKVENNLRKYDQYLNCLEKEIQSYGADFSSFRLDSLYVGGGTPTLLTEDQLQRLFILLAKYFYFNQRTQIVVEGTPESLSFNKLKTLKNLGVNRLTIGAQSFDDKILKKANRGHDSKDIIKAFKNAQRAGFDNINLDFLFELPGEDELSYQKTLTGIKRIKPQSLSLLFYVSGGQVLWPDDNWSAAQIKQRNIKDKILPIMINQLKKIGYKTVGGMSENLFLVLNGKEKYLNRGIINRYKLKPVLGLGAGAGSWQKGLKYYNGRLFDEYIQALLRNQKNLFYGVKLSPQDLVRRYLIHYFALRDFVLKEDFKRTFGFTIDRFLSKNFNALLTSGLLVNGKDRIELVTDWQDKIRKNLKADKKYSRQELISIFCLRYIFSKNILKSFYNKSN